jgi:signal transduction histidine kinase
MPETVTIVQQALSFLGIQSEAVVRALDVLASNHITFHPVSTLALRMQVNSDEANALLNPLVSRLVEVDEQPGESAYCLAPANQEMKDQMDILLASYRSEKEELRETLSHQSEILRMRAELDFSQDLMETILNNVGEILIIDLEGTVMATSAFVEQTLGISKGNQYEILQACLGFDPLDHQVEKCDIQIQDLFLECHLSDFVSRGKTIGRNISIKDVTEERRHQEARAMYEKSRKQLFSIIAHELQNPVLGLQSFLQDSLDMIDRLLVSGRVPDFEQDLLLLKEDVYLNQRGQTLLNRVIGDIFDYVKLQRGQMQFTIESDVSVDYLLALCSMQCTPLCTRKSIQLVNPPDNSYDGFPELLGDSTRLVQVLNNLVKNAVKFTPARGEIRLDVNLAEEHDPGTNELRPFIRINISDTGRGMTEDEMDMIFKEYRGSQSDGMGLGLMISDLIVKAHGGRIDLTSEIGRGSSFHVMLPVTQVYSSARGQVSA